MGIYHNQHHYLSSVTVLWPVRSAEHLAHSGVTNLRRLLATKDQPPTLNLIAADRAKTVYRMFAVMMG